MTINLNPTERAVLLDMLERLSDYLSAAGCNDYEIEATPEAAYMLMQAYRTADNDEDWMPDFTVRSGKYSCDDKTLLYYLRQKIEGGRMTAITNLRTCVRCGKPARYLVVFGDLIEAFCGLHTDWRPVDGRLERERTCVREMLGETS